jgi:MFS family permease
MRKGRAGWWVVAACFVCLFGEAIGTYVFTPMLKPVVSDLGWTRTQFTLAGLWVTIVMVAGIPLAGILTDRGWGRTVLATGALFLGASMYAFASMQTIGQFYAIASVMGLGIGWLGGIPTSALVSRWFLARRGLALGVAGLGHNVGGLMLPPLITWMIDERGWRSAFLYLAWFVWLLVLPVILLLVRPAPREGTSQADASSTAGRLQLREGARSPTFWWLGTAIFLHVLYFSAVVVHFLAFTTDLGFTPSLAATAFGAMLGLGLVGRLVGGWAADRFGRKPVIETALLGTVVAALLLLRLRAPGVLPAFVVVQGTSSVVVQTVFALLVAESFGAQNVGTFLGAMAVFQVPGGVLGTILAAASFDRLGTYAPAFACFAFGNVAAAAAIACVRPAGAVATPIASPVLQASESSDQ